MSALAEALVAAQAELPCALGKDATARNDEDYEYALDAQWRTADIIHKTDLYDSQRG